MAAFSVSDLFSSSPSGDTFRPLPFLRITPRSTDAVVPYYQGVSRLYLISQEYYDSPDYEQLLLLANPEWLGEFDIPDGELLRVPLPLGEVVGELYQQATAWLSVNP
jgi:hypothetical protein